MKKFSKLVDVNLRLEMKYVKAILNRPQHPAVGGGGVCSRL
jgi:hypothetical protein